MAWIVIFFGALIALLCLAIMAVPGRLVGLMTNVRATHGLRVFAAVVRFVIGACLIAIAGGSAFPTTLYVIGAIMIGAGFVALIMRDAHVQQIFTWVRSLPLALVRGWAALGMAFGGFLVYASL